MSSEATIAEFFRKRAVESMPPVGRKPLTGADTPDTDDMDASVFSDDGMGAADGQTFYIEYIDAQGVGTGRVITVYNIIQSTAVGVPILVSFCTLRMARRQFRVDRIRQIADLDGIVIEQPARFLAETFGMDPDFAAYVATDTADFNEFATRKRALSTPVQHQTRLLAALSHSDGEMLPVEVDEILKYLDGELIDFMPDDQDHRILTDYIRRMRMTERSVDRALNHVIDLDGDAQRRFLNAAIKVVLADGRRHPNEIHMINEFAVDLFGARIM